MAHGDINYLKLSSLELLYIDYGKFVSTVALDRPAFDLNFQAHSLHPSTTYLGNFNTDVFFVSGDLVKFLDDTSIATGLAFARASDSGYYTILKAMADECLLKQTASVVVTNTSTFHTPQYQAYSLSLPPAPQVAQSINALHSGIGGYEPKCDCGGKAIGLSDYQVGHLKGCPVHEDKK